MHSLQDQGGCPSPLVWLIACPWRKKEGWGCQSRYDAQHDSGWVLGLYLAEQRKGASKGMVRTWPAAL